MTVHYKRLKVHFTLFHARCQAIFILLPIPYKVNLIIKPHSSNIVGGCHRYLLMYIYLVHIPEIKYIIYIARIHCSYHYYGDLVTCVVQPNTCTIAKGTDCLPTLLFYTFLYKEWLSLILLIVFLNPFIILATVNVSAPGHMTC